MNRKPKGGGGRETPKKENLVEEAGIPHAHKCVVQGFPSQAITGDLRLICEQPNEICTFGAEMGTAHPD